MKLHLLFVFLLAAPLIGRVLSSDTAATSETCDSSSPKSAEVQATPVAQPVTAPAPQIRASTPAPAPAKPATHRTSRLQAFMFM